MRFSFSAAMPMAFMVAVLQLLPCISSVPSAIWGQGEGLQGQCYAIPTMEGMDNMKAAIERFTQFADQHSELRFLVTRVGCGVAGYSVREVAPLFKGCISLENVALPSDFWDVLGLKLNL